MGWSRFQGDFGENGVRKIPGGFLEDSWPEGQDWEDSRGLWGGWDGADSRGILGEAGRDGAVPGWRVPRREETLGKAIGKSQREEAADAAGLEICWKQTDGPWIPGEWKSLDGG